MKKGGSVSTSLLVVAVLLVSVLLGVGLVAAGATEDVAGSVGTADVSDRTAGVSTFSDSVSDAIDPQSTPTATDDTDTIHLQNGLFLTEEAGTVGVTTRAAIPDRVTELEITLHSANDATVDADGFEPADDTSSDEEVWSWDGETEAPSLTYVMDANDTVDEQGPIATDGTYRFVDTGGWALVQAPRLTATWSYTGQFSGQVRIERENVVDGEGAASRTMAFLGPHEEHVHEGVDGRYRLIVPDAADLGVLPDDVFAVFDAAATALRVGAADDEVFAVAAPTGEVSWAVRGLQTGDADLWVRDEETLETPDDVWTHESFTLDSRIARSRAAGGSPRPPPLTTRRCSRSNAEMSISTRSSERSPAASEIRTHRQSSPIPIRGRTIPTTRKARSSPASSTGVSGWPPTAGPRWRRCFGA